MPGRGVETEAQRARPELLLRWASYVVLFWMIVIGVAGREGVQQFIYFQF